LLTKKEKAWFFLLVVKPPKINGLILQFILEEEMLCLSLL